jgi:hypothetical protein
MKLMASPVLNNLIYLLMTGVLELGATAPSRLRNRETHGVSAPEDGL